MPSGIECSGFGDHNGQGAQIFRRMPIKDSGEYRHVETSNQMVLDDHSMRWPPCWAVDALSDRPCDDGTNVPVVQARNVGAESIPGQTGLLFILLLDLCTMSPGRS
jgi:hypothetical protein